MNDDTQREVGGKKSFPLRKFAIIAGLCTAVGYIFVFLSPLYPPAEYLESPGLLLSIIGEVMLLGAFVVHAGRSQRLQRYNDKNWSLTYSAIVGGYKVVILGVVSLVVSRIVQAIIWPAPPGLSSQESASLVQNLPTIIVGGMFFGFVIGFYFVIYSSRIPSSNPVYRALAVTFVVVLIVSGLGTLLHLNDAVSYFLWTVAYAIPSYLVLGIVLGYSYQRFDSERTIKALQGQPVKRRAKLYY